MLRQCGNRVSHTFLEVWSCPAWLQPVSFPSTTSTFKTECFSSGKPSCSIVKQDWNDLHWEPAGIQVKKKKKKRKGCAEVAVSMYFTRRFAFSSERDQWLCEIGESCREVTVVDCSLAELLHLLWNLEQPQHKMQLSILNMLWEWKEKLYCKQAVNKEKNYLFNLNEEPGSHPDTINSTYLKDNIMLFLDIPVRWVFCEVKRVGGLLTLRRLQN